jgi:tetratricopeptide (TPR) repeat protein
MAESENETALWHRRLALALRDKAKYDEALEHFTKALELDSTMWEARGGMAVVHVLKGEHRKAIELDKVTEGKLQQKLTNDPTTVPITEMNLHEIQERLAESYEAMKDGESAFEWYRNAHRNYANCDSCAHQILSKMHAKGLQHDVIDLLKTMGEKSPGEEFTLLTRFLVLWS